jgi:DNA-binding NtrC family response regulator
LNVFSIHLPPLRERMDDVPLLAQAFVTEFSERNGRSVAAVSERAMAVLQQHAWPGNVRELRNVIERATIIAAGRFIEPADLSIGARLSPAPHTHGAGDASLTPGMTVDEAEARLIQLTLEHTGNNKTRAAEMLGISLKTLHNKLNRTLRD